MAERIGSQSPQNSQRRLGESSVNADLRPKILPEPIMPLTHETYNQRYQEFIAETQRVRRGVNEPNAKLDDSTVQMLRAKYGTDVVLEAIYKRIIVIG